MREAIDLAFPGDWPDRRRAVGRLLEAEAVEPGAWEDIKDDLESDLYGRPAR